MWPNRPHIIVGYINNYSYICDGNYKFIKTTAMEKKRLLLLMTALVIGLGWLQAQTGVKGCTVKAKAVSDVGALLRSAKGSRMAALKRADDEPQRNVQSALTFEKLPDMSGDRRNHQIFPSGSGFVVIGGNNSQLEHTHTAELYQNGSWQTLTPASSANDPTFSVILDDGRVMVGGGNPAGAGSGQSKGTAIYNPATQKFTAGPDMTVARTNCNGIVVNGKVYVAGNWFEDDKVYDCYDGTRFTAFGKAGGYQTPYLFADSNGSLFEVAPKTSDGEAVQLRTSSKGVTYFPGYMYDVTDGKTYYYMFDFVDDHLLDLPNEMSPSDYSWGDYNIYFLLTKNDAGQYKMGIFIPDGLADGYDYYVDEEFKIPTKNAADNATITWRGGVFFNEAKGEAYIIGTSGSGNSQNVHIISYSIMDGSYTIATATGFDADLTIASWTLLADGRLACSGGNGPNYSVSKKAYIFAPPTAGTSSGTEPGPDMVTRTFLVVETRNGGETTFMLSEKPEATFEGQYLRVKSEKADVLFAITDVLRFTYVKHSVVGIDDLQVDTEPTEVNFQQDGTLVISQLKAGASVGVYALDGKLVQRLKARHKGTYRLSLSSLPKGVYIVKADNITYKIMKR